MSCEKDCADFESSFNGSAVPCGKHCKAISELRKQVEALKQKESNKLFVEMVELASNNGLITPRQKAEILGFDKLLGVP